MFGRGQVPLFQLFFAHYQGFFVDLLESIVGIVEQFPGLSDIASIDLLLVEMIKFCTDIHIVDVIHLHHNIFLGIF